MGLLLAWLYEGGASGLGSRGLDCRRNGKENCNYYHGLCRDDLTTFLSARQRKVPVQEHKA